MAWIHNGRKYWYHNGKRYSRSIKRKKSYYWVDGSGKSRSTDYQGYVEAKKSGLKVHTGSGFKYTEAKAGYNPEFWDF